MIKGVIILVDLLSLKSLLSLKRSSAFDFTQTYLVTVIVTIFHARNRQKFEVLFEIDSLGAHVHYGTPIQV